MQLTSIDWLFREDIQFILKTFQARVVGGAVRNSILGLDYNEIDLATPLTTDEMINIARESGLSYAPTGVSHGTVTIIHNKQCYEITTLRKDVETDGRHAVVEFTNSWEEDAARRDFTINALYLDAEGNIYDYFDGIADIKRRIVRFIGNPLKRIQEDYLRIMRFFRFLAYYGQELHQPSLDACYELKDGLVKVSKERIWFEIHKLVQAPRPLQALRLMRPVTKSIGWPVPTDLIDTAFSNIENKKYRKTELFKDINSDQTPVESGGVRTLHPLLILALFDGSWEDCKISNQKLRFINILRDMKLITKGEWLRARYQQTSEWLEAKIEYDIVVHGTDRNVIESYLSDFKNNKFPVNGRDLLELGYSGLDVGQKLSSLQSAWFESGMTLDKDALMALDL